MNEHELQTPEPIVDLSRLSDGQIEQLIVEGSKILKKRKDSEIKHFQAEIRRKAKEKGLKVSFEELSTKTRAKSGA